MTISHFNVLVADLFAGDENAYLDIVVKSCPKCNTCLFSHITIFKFTFR